MGVTDVLGAGETYVAARSPRRDHRDFGHAHQDRVLQPQRPSVLCEIRSQLWIAK
jgi:hypothetical protein